MEKLTNKFIENYKNCNFKFKGNTNGYYLHFFTNKQIIFVCFDNVKQQIKKRLIKRNILIKYETNKIYIKKENKNINIFLIEYNTKSEKLSAKAVLKKYEIKEKQKRKDKNLQDLLKNV